MGQMQSAPVELIRVQKQKGAIASVAVAEMQGWRDAHEDAHFMSEMDGGNGWACFGVLDGHGGWQTARKAAQILPQHMKKAMKGKKATEGLRARKKLEDAFEEVDELVKEALPGERDTGSGSTCISGLIKMDQSTQKYSCYLANAGDSRGIIVRIGEDKRDTTKAAAANGAVVAATSDEMNGDKEDNSPSADGEEQAKTRRQQLLEEMEKNNEAEDSCVSLSLSSQSFQSQIKCSQDHKPSKPSELERIRKAGGYVSGIAETPGMMMAECPRLDGNLAVSRGFGDFQYKQGLKIPACEQKVSCHPELFALNDLHKGDLMILACDGVFDVMSNHDLVEFILKKYEALSRADPSQRREDLLGKICRMVLQDCLTRDSKDNMTILIAQMGGPTDAHNTTESLASIVARKTVAVENKTDPSVDEDSLTTEPDASRIANGTPASAPSPGEKSQQKNEHLPTFEQEVIFEPKEGEMKLRKTLQDGRMLDSYHTFLSFCIDGGAVIPESIAKQLRFGGFKPDDATSRGRKGRGSEELDVDCSSDDDDDFLIGRAGSGLKYNGMTQSLLQEMLMEHKQSALQKAETASNATTTATITDDVDSEEEMNKVAGANGGTATPTRSPTAASTKSHVHKPVTPVDHSSAEGQKARLQQKLEQRKAKQAQESLKKSVVEDGAAKHSGAKPGVASGASPTPGTTGTTAKDNKIKNGSGTPTTAAITSPTATTTESTGASKPAEEKAASVVSTTTKEVDANKNGSKTPEESTPASPAPEPGSSSPAARRSDPDSTNSSKKKKKKK
ncbi:unnamed protein product [Amoebophrya sp. A25]|nr:unnamed protein product [Amoebophrya sp. A25]|eukprot:GSA25T00017397001.1